ncbi:MAG: glycosyltransferase family 4 protein [Ruthenibacterium sp.]
MKKLAFIIPWFSADVRGGAEVDLRDTTIQLAARGVELEIFATCVESFSADWEVNFFPRGIEKIHGITVRRFLANGRDGTAFGGVNALLMQGKQPSLAQECVFFSEMVNSDEMIEYISSHRQEYSLFVFTPYMFSTTYFGARAAGKQAVLIPCLHEEAYVHMQLMKTCFENVGGIAFNSEPESALAHTLYCLDNVKTTVAGDGMDVSVSGEAARFCEKYNMKSPFILYAGRKDSGKNVDALVKNFMTWKACTPENDVKLILIGGGTLSLPSDAKQDILDFGYVPLQDKYDAMAAALFLCQPSLHESFSLVIMESWLCGRPVLVHGQCAVTKNFAQKSGGGLYFNTCDEFIGALNYFLSHPQEAVQMGENGGAYVRANFSWDTVTQRYIDFFESLAEE